MSILGQTISLACSPHCRSGNVHGTVQRSGNCIELTALPCWRVPQRMLQRTLQPVSHSEIYRGRSELSENSRERSDDRRRWRISDKRRRLSHLTRPVTCPSACSTCRGFVTPPPPKAKSHGGSSKTLDQSRVTGHDVTVSGRRGTRSERDTFHRTVCRRSA